MTDITLSVTERDYLVRRCREDLEYCHETLRDEPGTLDSAMATFDAWPEVTLLKRLSPESHAHIRACVLEDIRHWFEDRVA